MPLLQWTNCTAPESTCTTQLDAVLGGVAGTCDAATGRCLCPAGNSGDDQLSLWNDCHVSNTVRLGIESTSSALIGVTLVVNVVVLVYVLVKWDVVRCGDRAADADFLALDPRRASKLSKDDSGGGGGVLAVGGPDRSSDSFPGGSAPVAGGGAAQGKRSSLGQAVSAFATGVSDPTAQVRRISSLAPQVNLQALQSPRTNAPTPAHTRAVAERARRRGLLVIILVDLVFCAGGVVCHVLRQGYDVRLEDANPAQYVFLGISLLAFMLNLWLVAYNWQSRLPSLRAFKSMFPDIENNFLVQHPYFILQMAVGNLVVATATTFSLFAAILATRASALPIVLPLFFALMLLEAVLYALAMTTVCFLLLRLFHMLRHLANSPSIANKLNAKPVRQQRTVSQAERTVWVVLGMICVGSPGAVVLLGLLVGYGPAQRNYTLFISLIWMIGSVVVSFAVVLLVRLETRMSGPRKSSLGAGALMSPNGGGGGGGGGSGKLAVRRASGNSNPGAQPRRPSRLDIAV